MSRTPPRAGGCINFAREWLQMNGSRAARLCNRRQSRLSFRVALRSQPIDPTCSIQPLVDLSLTLESSDEFCFHPFAFGRDLPIALRDALHSKRDPRLLRHCFSTPVSNSISD